MRGEFSWTTKLSKNYHVARLLLDGLYCNRRRYSPLSPQVLIMERYSHKRAIEGQSVRHGWLDASPEAERVGIGYPVLVECRVASAIAERNSIVDRPAGEASILLSLLIPFKFITKRCPQQTRIEFAVGRRGNQLPLVAQFQQVPERGYFWTISLRDDGGDS